MEETDEVVVADAEAPTTEVGNLGRGAELSRIFIEDTNVSTDTPAQDRQLTTIHHDVSQLSFRYQYRGHLPADGAQLAQYY